MSDRVSGRSSASPPTSPAPALPQLFAAFALISLCGFGGVLAWSRRMLVEQRRWMTAAEFSETFSPRPPLGFNYGRHMLWLKAVDPGAFAAARFILGYPQY